MPTLAAGFVLVAVFWPQLFTKEGGIADIAVVDRAQVDVDEAVVNATYSGVDRSGRPFSLKSKRVRNLEAGEHLLQLTEPDAEVALKDGTTLKISADTGTYDRHADALELQGGVILKRGADVTVRTSRATIELDAGVAYGRQPVEGASWFGTIAGQGFRVTDRGDKILVDGPATLLINSKAEPRLP